MPLPQITWQDVQELPEDGKRYEAIEGDLYVSAAPSVRHQSVSQRIEWALEELLVDPGHGLLFHAPIGVEFPATGEGVQPDILFVSRERRRIIAEQWLVGTPDLVVEIVSPSTASRDRGIKRRLYERQGVREYWIVDPGGRRRRRLALRGRAAARAIHEEPAGPGRRRAGGRDRPGRGLPPRLRRSRRRLRSSFARPWSIHGFFGT